MALTAAEIMTDGGQILPLARDIRDALSTYARRTWPRDTAKHAARAWKIPKDTAANILKGHASAATLTHVLREGGWGLAHAVVGAVIGQSFEGWLNEERGRIARERRHAEDQERRLVALAGRVRSWAAPVDDLSDRLAEPADHQRQSDRARAAGRLDRGAD